MIQHYEETDEEFRHAGIDLFLGAPYHGRGLGTDAVRTMARHLIDDRGHHRLTIDPAAHNERAIRCYEKVGFKRVGVMREYWLDAEGVWRDGLLLDMLAAELTSTVSAIEWLLESEEPGVVFQAKRDLLGEQDPPEAERVLDGQRVRPSSPGNSQTAASASTSTASGVAHTGASSPSSSSVFLRARSAASPPPRRCSPG